MTAPPYTLVDAEAKAATVELPHVFEIPTKEERQSLAPDDLVKLCFTLPHSIGGCTGERMWVRVTECRSNGDYLGVLDNHPTAVEIHLGDAVLFSARHVLDIYPAEELVTA